MLSCWCAQGSLPQGRAELSSACPRAPRSWHGPSCPQCLNRGWSTTRGNGVVSFCAPTGATAARFPECWSVLEGHANATWPVAAAPHGGMLQQSGQEPRQAFATGAQSGWAEAEPLDSSVPAAWGCIPTQLSGVARTPGSLPSLSLGFRCTNPRDQTLPLQPVRGTSPPPPLRWALLAVRTPLKRHRLPFRVTPATTLDCPPILMSGMCKGSWCPARDWTKCVGNEEKKKDKPSQLQIAPTEMEFSHQQPHRATPS